MWDMNTNSDWTNQILPSGMELDQLDTAITIRDWEYPSVKLLTLSKELIDGEKKRKRDELAPTLLAQAKQKNGKIIRVHNGISIRFDLISTNRWDFSSSYWIYTEEMIFVLGKDKPGWFMAFVWESCISSALINAELSMDDIHTAIKAEFSTSEWMPESTKALVDDTETATTRLLAASDSDFKW